LFSLEPELTHLRDSGTIAEATAAPLIAVERREIVNLYGELRFLTWAAVMLIATGVGIVVTRNLDRIGPLSVAVALGAAAFACYAWAFWKRSRAASLTDDYILLLAALLLSADAGFVEHTWHLLGRNWNQYLLLLAVVHAATAYCFNSRLVLSVALTSLAAWFGIRRELDTLFDGTPDNAVSVFACAATLFAWRYADNRVRVRRTFEPVFEHFAANLAFWGALILTNDNATQAVGGVLALTFAGVSSAFGVKKRREMFVVYAWVYGLIAVNIVVSRNFDSVLATLFAIISTFAAIIGLFVIHTRMTASGAPSSPVGAPAE
jgi:hypothetical protein